MFLVMEHQISSAEELTSTIIYFDFKVFILKLQDLDKIANFVNKLDKILMPQTFPAHTSLLKVYGDITQDLARLDDVNSATFAFLNDKVAKPSQNLCLFTRSNLDKNVFKDLIEGFYLLFKAVLAITDLTETHQKSVISPTLINMSRILFD